MNRAEFEKLVAQARPIDDDWGSERQVSAENAVYAEIDKLGLTEAELEKFEIWASKATTDEIMDEALRIFARHAGSKE